MVTFFLLFALLSVLATAAYASLRAAPWVPTKAADVERLIRLAQIKPGETVYELGCGDGRLVEAAARAGARAIGFELSLPLYWIAKWRCRQLQRQGLQAEVRWGNFFRIDLSSANVVLAFLMPRPLAELAPKFQRELNPGSRIVSYVFRVHGWEAQAVDKVEGRATVYLYQL